LLTFDVQFDPEGQEDLRIHVSGRAESGEFERFYDELVADPRFRPGMKILADFRELDLGQLHAGSIASIGRAVADREEQWGAARYAIVVPNSMAFGLVRMAELTAHLQQMTVWPVYTLADAEAWLALDAPPGG
jgi:hypothetical protein